MLKKQALVFLLLIVLSKSTFSQVTAKTPAKETKPSGAAKGSLAADMDCTVKLNGSPNFIQVKAYSPLVVPLKTGVNSIEATSMDKKSSFRTSVKGVPGELTLVEISFYDDSRFLEYVK